MAWARIDDKFLDNPKVRKAGKEATYLYISALIYSSSQITEGFISDESLGLVAFKGFIKNENSQAKKLVECDLWDRVEGGYQIHDYLEYNPTKEEIEEARAKKAAAGRKGGKATAKAKYQAPAQASAQAPAQADAIASAETNAEADAQALLQQSPSINPSHINNTTTTGSARDDLAEIVKAYESEIGVLTGMVREKLVAALEDYPKDWIIKAFEICASNNQRKWSYAEAILKRWKVDGFQVDSRQKINGNFRKRTDKKPDIAGYVPDKSNEEVVYDD